MEDKQVYMTIEERNKMSNRERTKQFLEKTIRDLADGMSDDKLMSLAEMNIVIDKMKDFSIIYKNMGFDKGEIE